MYVYMNIQKPKEGVGSLEAGVSGGCKLPYVGTNSGLFKRGCALNC